MSRSLPFACCTLILLLARLVAHAQAPAWQTLVTPGSATSGSYSRIAGTAADAQGNVYVAGTFSGSITLGATSLTSAGLEDMFTAKWSPSRNQFVWAQRAGGAGGDFATGIAVQGSSVYLTGVFEGSAAFGSLQLLSAGGRDGVVAKLDGDVDGRFQWAIPFGGAADEYPAAVAAVGARIYLTGYFQSAQLAFGSSVLSNASRNGFLSDGFVARLDDAGPTAAFGWVQPVAGTGDDLIRALAVEGNNVYLTGGFSNSVAFGSTTLTGGGLSAFVAKLVDAGPTSSFAWAIQAGGILITNGIAVSGANVYLAGRFVYTVTLGTTSFTSPAGGGYNMVVAKIADGGGAASFTWATQAGGSMSDYAEGLTVQGNRVYVVGSFGGTVGFGNTSLTCAGNNNDVVVARLTDAGSSGAFDWARAAGGSINGTTSEGGTAVVATVNPTTGNLDVYVGGIVAPLAGFGPLQVAASAASDVAFLASLTDAMLPTAAPHLPAGISCYPNPARGAITLRLPTGTAQAELTIADALGRPVRTHRVAVPASGEQVLSLLGLAPGCYLLRITAGATAGVQRLVVQ